MSSLVLETSSSSSSSSSVLPSSPQQERDEEFIYPSLPLELLVQRFLEELHKHGLSDPTGLLNNYSVEWPELSETQVSEIKHFMRTQHPLCEKSGSGYVTVGEFQLETFLKIFTQKNHNRSLGNATLHLSQTGLCGSAVFPFISQKDYLAKCFKKLKPNLSEEALKSLLRHALPLLAAQSEARDIDLSAQVGYFNGPPFYSESWIRAMLRAIGESIGPSALEAANIKNRSIILKNPNHNPLVVGNTLALIVEAFGDPTQSKVIDCKVKHIPGRDYRTPADSVSLITKDQGGSWFVSSTKIKKISHIQALIDHLNRLIRLVDKESINNYCWGTLMVRLSKGWKGAGEDNMGFLLQRLPFPERRKRLLEAISKRCDDSDSAFATAFQAGLCGFRHEKGSYHTEILRAYCAAITETKVFSEEKTSPVMRRLLALTKTESFENVLAQLQTISLLGLHDPSSGIVESSHFQQKALRISLTPSSKGSSLLFPLDTQLITTQVDPELLNLLCPQISTVLQDLWKRNADSAHGLTRSQLTDIAVNYYTQNPVSELAFSSPALFAEVLKAGTPPVNLDYASYMTLLKKRLLHRGSDSLLKFLSIWSALPLDDRCELLEWMLTEQASLCKEWNALSPQEGPLCFEHALKRLQTHPTAKHLDALLTLLPYAPRPNTALWQKILPFASYCPVRTLLCFCQDEDAQLTQKEEHILEYLLDRLLEEPLLPLPLQEQLLTRQGPLPLFLSQPGQKGRRERVSELLSKSLGIEILEHKHPKEHKLLQKGAAKNLGARERLELVQQLLREGIIKSADPIVSEWLLPLFKPSKGRAKLLSEHLPLIQQLGLLKSLPNGPLLEALIDALCQHYIANQRTSPPINTLLYGLQKLSPPSPMLWKQFLKVAVLGERGKQVKALTAFCTTWAHFPPDPTQGGWRELAALGSHLQDPFPEPIREQLLAGSGPLVEVLRASPECPAIYLKLIALKEFYRLEKREEQLAALLQELPEQRRLELLLNCPKEEIEANKGLLRCLAAQLFPTEKESLQLLNHLPIDQCKTPLETLNPWLMAKQQEVLKEAFRYRFFQEGLWANLDSEAIASPRFYLGNLKKKHALNYAKRPLKSAQEESSLKLQAKACELFLHLSRDYLLCDPSWWQEALPLWQLFPDKLLTFTIERIEQKILTSDEAKALSLSLVIHHPKIVESLLEKGLCVQLSKADLATLCHQLHTAHSAKLPPLFNKLSSNCFSNAQSAKMSLTQIAWKTHQKLYKHWSLSLTPSQQQFFLEAWALQHIQECFTRKVSLCFPPELHEELLRSPHFLPTVIEQILSLAPSVKYKEKWVYECLKLLLVLKSPEPSLWHQLRNQAVSCKDVKLHEELLLILYERKPCDTCSPVERKQEIKDHECLLRSCSRIPRPILRDFIVNIPRFTAFFKGDGEEMESVFASAALHVLHQEAKHITDLYISQKKDQEQAILHLDKRWEELRTSIDTLDDPQRKAETYHELIKRQLEHKLYSLAIKYFPYTLKNLKTHDAELLASVKILLKQWQSQFHKTTNLTKLLTTFTIYLKTSDHTSPQDYLEILEELLAMPESKELNRALAHTTYLITLALTRQTPKEQARSISLCQQKLASAIDRLLLSPLEKINRQVLFESWKRLYPLSKARIPLLTDSLERNLLLELALSAVVAGDSEDCLRIVFRYGQRIKGMVLDNDKPSLKKRKQAPLNIKYLFDQKNLAKFLIPLSVAQVIVLDRKSLIPNEFSEIQSLAKAIDLAMDSDSTIDVSWRHTTHDGSLQFLEKLERTEKNSYYLLCAELISVKALSQTGNSSQMSLIKALVSTPALELGSRGQVFSLATHYFERIAERTVQPMVST